MTPIISTIPVDVPDVAGHGAVFACGHGDYGALALSAVGQIQFDVLINL